MSKPLSEGQLVLAGCMAVVGKLIFWLILIAAAAYAYRWAVAP